MALTIRYGSYCVPQEQQTNSTKPFWLDGDCGRKLGGNNTYTVANLFVAPAIKTATESLAATQDFIAIKALEIGDSSYVLISLDNGENYPIRLLEGECFASKIGSSSRAKLAICTNLNGSGTGSGRVDVWSAT